MRWTGDGREIAGKTDPKFARSRSNREREKWDLRRIHNRPAGGVASAPRAPAPKTACVEDMNAEPRNGFDAPALGALTRPRSPGGWFVLLALTEDQVDDPAA